MSADPCLSYQQVKIVFLMYTCNICSVQKIPVTPVNNSLSEAQTQTVPLTNQQLDIFLILYVLSTMLAIVHLLVITQDNVVVNVCIIENVITK